MAFEKLKQQAPQASLMPTQAPLSAQAPSIPQRQPGIAEQLAMKTAQTGANSLAKKGAETLFAKVAPTVAAETAATAAAAPLSAMGTAAATGGAGAAATGAATAATGGAAAAGGGALGSGLMAAAMTNPITAPLAVGAALFGGKKLMGK